MLWLVVGLYVVTWSRSTFATPFISEPRIINGVPAASDATKHQVSIRLKSQEVIFGLGHICGGSLIGLNKVLTAAHCLYE